MSGDKNFAMQPFFSSMPFSVSPDHAGAARAPDSVPIFIVVVCICY